MQTPHIKIIELSPQDAEAMHVIESWPSEAIFDGDQPTAAAVSRLAEALKIDPRDARLTMRYLWTKGLLNATGTVKVDPDRYAPGLRQIIHQAVAEHKNRRNTLPDNITQVEYQKCLEPLISATITAAKFAEPFLVVSGRKKFNIGGILSTVKRRKPSLRAIDVSAVRLTDCLEEIEARYDDILSEVEIEA